MSNVSSLVCKQLLCSRSYKSVLIVIHSHCPCNWGNHCIVEATNLFLQWIGFIALLIAVGITVVYCKLATRFANARKLLHQVMILVLAVV